MDLLKLKKHIKLCRKNLKDSRTKCCANCPFEEEIVLTFPELGLLFDEKREQVKNYERELKNTIKMSKMIPNLGRKCKKCGGGLYTETSINDNMDGILHCKKCGHEIKAYRNG